MFQIIIHMRLLPDSSLNCSEHQSIAVFMEVMTKVTATRSVQSSFIEKKQNKEKKT